jgi:hypothetical protein
MLKDVNVSVVNHGSLVKKSSVDNRADKQKRRLDGRLFLGNECWLLRHRCLNGAPGVLSTAAAGRRGALLTLALLLLTLR